MAMTSKKGLKILIAGCSPQERAPIESIVAAAFGSRSESGPWSVSLVRLGEQWSVTIDGPEAPFKGLNFMATQHRLRESIAEAIRGGRTAVEPEPAPPMRPGGPERRDRHNCQKCSRPFAVVYEALPNEPQTKVPVACPHCWQVNKVSVAEGAGLNDDYRAEPIHS